MGIRFRCHHCEHELNLKEFQAGRRARCPVCSGRFRVPTTSCDFSTPLEDDEQELAPAAAREDQPGAGGPGAGRSQTSPPFELKQPTADLERFKRGQPDGQHHGQHPSAATSKPSQKPARQSKKQAPSKAATSKAKAAGQEVAEKAAVDNAAATAAATAASAGIQDTATQPASAQAAPSQSSAAQSSSAQSPQVAPAGNEAATQSPSAAGSPGLPRAIAEAPQAVWYVRPPSGGQFGPADSATFYQWMKENRVAREALVWRDGWPQWMNAGEAFEEYYGSRWLLPDAPAGQPAESVSGVIPAGAAAPVGVGLADSPVGTGVVEASIIGGAAEPSSGEAAPAGALGSTAVGTPIGSPIGTSIGSPGVVRPVARRKRRKTNYTLWITVLAIVAIALVVVLVAVLMSQ